MHHLPLSELPAWAELPGHAVTLDAGVATVDGQRPQAFLLELESPDGECFVEVRLGELRTRALVDPREATCLVDGVFAFEHPEAFTLAHGRGELTGARIAGATFAPAALRAADLTDVDSAWPVTLVLGRSLLDQAGWFFDLPGHAWGLTRKPVA